MFGVRYSGELSFYRSEIVSAHFLGAALGSRSACWLNNMCYRVLTRELWKSHQGEKLALASLGLGVRLGYNPGSCLVVVLPLAIFDNVDLLASAKFLPLALEAAGVMVL